MSDHDSHPDDDALPLPPSEGAGFFGAEPPSPVVATTEPYRVLARKYRPLHFDDLIGQESTVRILRRAFALGRVAHAFMLTGVRGVGKTTTARIIARALNCVGADGQGRAAADPCGVCANCKAILADRHPDVLEMDAASRTGVDDIREIIDQTRFRPIQGRMKVFIIDEVHMLSRNAFNALLKTLEEPPESVTFIFATTEIRKVPVTVLSRCQRFDLRRVPADMLVAHFDAIAQKENVAFSTGALRLVARASDGSVRDGLSLLDQAIARGAEDGAERIEEGVVSAMLGLSDRETVYDLYEAILEGNTALVLDISAKVYALGVDLGTLLTDQLDLIHFLSRLKSVPSLRERPDLTESERLRGGALADKVPMAALGRSWQIIVHGLKELEIAPDRRAAAEMILLRLCYAQTLPSPDDLVRRMREGGGVPSTEKTARPQDAETSATSSEAGRVTTIAHSAEASHVKPVPGNGPGLHLVADNTFASQRETMQVKPSQSQREHPSEGQGESDMSDTSRVDAVTAARELLPSVVAASAVISAGAEAAAESRPAPPSGDGADDIRGDAGDPPAIRSWRELVAFVKWSSNPLMHGLLRHAAHCVRFAPPEVSIRLQNGADPRSLVRLQSVLNTWYPGMFVISASREEGEPTLDELGAQVMETHRQSMQEHPLVQAIITHFPQAELGQPRGLSLDDYGLPPEELDAEALPVISDDLILPVDLEAQDDMTDVMSYRYNQG